MEKITLRMAREMRGYTVEEVAKKCGVGVSKITQIEENPKKLRASMALKFRMLYEIPLDYIRL